MCKKSKVETLTQNILDCRKCHLCPNSVPGTGDIDATIMMVGEAPGENEAELQEPFIGPAGQLLNKLFDDSNISRQTVYITNTVKGRPHQYGKNRAPSEEEIQICRGWLWQEIQVIQPKIIVTLGKVATYTLLHSQIKKNFLMKTVVGKLHYVDYYDGVFVPCYHPSFLLQHGKKQIQQCVDIFKSLKGIVL